MYEEYDQVCQGHTTPLFAVSKAGENIIIDKGEDEHGAYYLVTTIRRNGWRVRMKEYRDLMNLGVFLILSGITLLLYRKINRVKLERIG